MTESASAKPRGWYHGWTIVAVCVLAGICPNALPINSFSLFLGNWSADLNAPISTFQLGIGAVGLGSALLSPIVGAMADKYPARILFAVGLICVTLFHLGVSLARETWQYLALYIGLLPIALVLPTMLVGNALVSRWFVHRLGLALGIISFGTGLGGVIMPPLVAAALPEIGWRAIWQIGAAVAALIALPLVLLALRDRPSEREGLHYLAGQAAPVTSHGAASPAAGEKLTLGAILSRRTFWLLIIAYLPMLGLFGGLAQNLAPIATSRGVSPQTAGLMLSLLSLTQLAGTLAAGMLSDRLGNRAPLAGLAFATATGGLLVAFGGDVVTLGLGFMLAGLGNAFWPLIAAAIAREFGAANVGRVFGLVSVFLPIIGLAPFAVAKAHESTGAYALPLVAIAAFCVISGAACALFMREKPRAQSAS